MPGAFEVTTAADAAAADQALRDREAYAAFVVAADGVSLHTASGASPTVAALLSQAAQQLGGGRPVTVVDVVPGAPDDPRGAGFASGLPAAGARQHDRRHPARGRRVRVARAPHRSGRVRRRRRARRRGRVARPRLLAGSYWAAGRGHRAARAVGQRDDRSASTRCLGAPGIGLGVLVVFLFGNPISAVAAAPELLPQPWGTIGQLLPPGAGATLLRSEAFFDGAGSAAPLWTLVAWAVVGLLLVAIGRAPVAAHSIAAGPGTRPQRRSPSGM